MPAPSGALGVYGGEKLAEVGRMLRAMGGPSARGVRSNLRRAVVAEAAPLKRAEQAAARNLPASGNGSTGLRAALATATQTKVLVSSRTALVRVWVNPARMPAGKRNLPAYVEGIAAKPWLHPVYPDGSETRDQWHWSKAPQAAHPYFYRTAQPYLAAARLRCVAAIRATVSQLPREL